MPTTRDAIIADAKSLPDLIATAQTLDPALAQALTGKAIVASKSTYGPTATLAVSWLVTHYALGWSPDQCALVSGGLILIVSAGLRAVTSGPITAWFQAPTAAAVGVAARL